MNVEQRRIDSLPEKTVQPVVPHQLVGTGLADQLTSAKVVPDSVDILLPELPFCIFRSPEWEISSGLDRDNFWNSDESLYQRCRRALCRFLV